MILIHNAYSEGEPLPRAMLTGHRKVNPLCLDTMLELLVQLIDSSSDEEDFIVISGGNLGTRTARTGADRYWALAADKLNIPFEIWVPMGYGAHYYGANPTMMESFNAMCNRASKVVYCPPQPFKIAHNFSRNTDMVKTADIYVACSNVHPSEILKHSSGGTAHCVKTMKAHGIKDVHWINAVSAKYEGLASLN